MGGQGRDPQSGRQEGSREGRKEEWKQKENKTLARWVPLSVLASRMSMEEEQRGASTHCTDTETEAQRGEMTCPRTHNNKGTEQDSYIVLCNSRSHVCAHMHVWGFLCPCQGEHVSYGCFKPPLDRGGRVPTYSINKGMRMSGVIHQLSGAQRLGRTQSFHSPLMPEYDLLSSAKSPRCQNLILISRTFGCTWSWDPSGPQEATAVY